jgi:acyl-CoA synthetase (NDP forming)
MVLPGSAAGLDEIIRIVRGHGAGALDEPTGKKLLASFGIRVPASRVVHSRSELASAVADLKPPYVLKVVSPEILHKSDFGAVRVGLAGLPAVERALAEIDASLNDKGIGSRSWLVEEMASPGLEVVIGGVVDPEFGPMVMAGIGGVFVEVMKDVAFRICPIDRIDAEEMLSELRGAALFHGARGRPKVSMDAVIETLLKIGGEHGILTRGAGEIAEIDINPLIVTPETATAVDARFILKRAVQGEAVPGSASNSTSFDALFAPATIAVVGASATSVAGGNRFIRHLKDFGYGGRIFPIHPSATEIEGMAAFYTVSAVPEPIDYAYVAVAAPQVPALIRSFAGRVRIAQVMSSGFSESAGGDELERELVRAARDAKVRVIGPNCLGVYSPRARVTFTERTTDQAGPVGVVCQSGGLGVDIIRRGQNRGVRFSGLVTVGNCADVRPHELLTYFLESPETSVIGLYLEGAGDGRRLFEILRAARGRKPVVILKGGSTGQGRRAAASHTGALAGRDEGWKALAAQTGAVLVEDLDTFLDVLLAFQCLSRRETPAHRAVLFGNGGGASVLGTDALARAGFDVAPFDKSVAAKLQALKLPAGSSVLNPIDLPAGALQQDEGRAAEMIFDAISEGRSADVLVMHVNMTVVLSFRHVDMLGNLMNAVLRVKSRDRSGMHVVLVLRSDGDPDIEGPKREYRDRAVKAGLPVFDELGAAAEALACVRHFEMFRMRGAENTPN